MLKEGENLQGTYDPVPKSSFTPQQLKQVIQTIWVVQPRPSQEGEASLKARFVAKGFKQQILDPSLETYASTPFHLSLRILLILSLVNRWDVVTDVSSVFLQAPIPSEELVLVKPPPELEQNPEVLYMVSRPVQSFGSNICQVSLRSLVSERTRQTHASLWARSFWS